jgi:acyl-CoA dehydrogenase
VTHAERLPGPLQRRRRPRPSPPVRGRAEASLAIAAAHAGEVDRDARFPAETLAQLRVEGLLGVLAPRRLGGHGGRLADAAELCFNLARACGSTAMIFAMHCTQVACLTRHAAGAEWPTALLAETVRDQLLFAGSTTDGAGGDPRASGCALTAAGDRLRLDKDASVFSYAPFADAALVTARRRPDSVATDQVLVALRRQDMVLVETRTWDAMGLRGTGSAGYRLRGDCAAEQVLPAPFGEIHPQTMLPFSHVLWSSVWLGIAADALDRARRRLRGSPSGAGGVAGARLAAAVGALQTLRAMVVVAIQEIDAAQPAQLATFASQTRLNLLKAEVSRGALQATLQALEICGVEGYRNDGVHSVSRHLRDICSAPLMIPNDRILQYAAQTSVLLDLNPGLFD